MLPGKGTIEKGGPGDQDLTALKYFLIIYDALPG